METPAEEVRSFEDYLKYTGWGLYYKFLVAVACACNLACGFSFVTITHAVALSTCDEYSIPESNVLRIFTCYLIGSGIGGLIGNSLSDRYGRKTYLSYSFMCIFFSAFTAAFGYNIVIVVGAIMILGVGLETNAIQMKLLLVEVLCKERRGFWITFCNMFWGLGYMLTAFLVILFETPVLLDMGRSLNIQLTTWRIMFAVSGGFNLFLACICAILEESPRFYLYAGRNYLAYLLLKQLYAINNSTFAETFKVKEDDIKYLIKPYDLTYMEPEPYWEIFKKFLWRLWSSIKLMFSKRFCKTTWVLILLKISIILFGFLQLNILLSKMASSDFKTTSQKFRGLDFIYPVFKPLSSISQEELHRPINICQQNEHNSIFYQYYLALGSAIIPGQVLTMFIIDRLERKIVLFAGLLLATCSFLIVRIIGHKIVQFVAMYVIIASISGLISTVTLINLELYPTALRGTSNAVTSFPGFLLAICFVNFIVIEQRVFIIILGILYACLSIFICFLPETKGQPLTE